MIGIRSRKKLVILLSVLLSLIVITTVGVLFSAISLQKQKAAMRAKGRLLTLADLAKESVPPQENAAPIYSQTFSTVSSPSSRPDFITLRKFLESGQLPVDPRRWDEVRKIVKRYQRVIPIIEQASTKPKCQFYIDWKQGNNAYFEHHSPMGMLSCLLAANTVITAKDGGTGKAVHMVELNMKLAKSLENEADLGANLTVVYNIKHSSYALREVISRGKINEAQARKLYNRFGSIDVYHSYFRATQGTIAICMDEFDQARKDPATFGCRMVSSSLVPKPDFRAKVMAYAWRPLSATDERAFLRYMNRQLDAATMSCREAAARNVRPDYQSIPKYAIYSRMVSPEPMVFGKARDEAAAELYGSRIFLALHVYRNRYGSYPPSLAELRKKIGWKLEKDPFSGKEFVYKTQNKGFVLYSLGFNMRDDGGRPRPSRSTRTGPDDVVWKM